VKVGNGEGGGWEMGVHGWERVVEGCRFTRRAQSSLRAV